MKRRVLLLVACVSFLFFASCARDALIGKQVGARVITISYTVQEPVNSSFYYFFVFNFTNSPSTDDTLRPYHDISTTADRGRNWEEYIIYSPATGTWGTLKKQPGQVDTDTSKWTDTIPFLLQNQYFYIGASASGATITITLDATKFTDVNGALPKNFILDFMTATTPIYPPDNPDGLGTVLDWLVTPEIVQVTPGFLDNNLRSPQHLLNKNHAQAPAPANLTDWSVQVT
jgi:hypothetical protein